MPQCMNILEVDVCTSSRGCDGAAATSLSMIFSMCVLSMCNRLSSCNISELDRIVLVRLVI